MVILLELKSYLVGLQKHSLEVGLSKFIKSLQNNTQEYPNNIDMVIYENIKSYSWLPSLL